MTHVLAELLGNDHPLFTFNLNQMEIASGYAGIDMRIYADSLDKAHAVMRALGLDPGDTSAPELYHALNESVQNGRAMNLLKNTSYVLKRFPEGVISFCLYDVIENAHHELPFEERIVGHGQRHLRAEVIKRYAEHDRTENTMIHNLARDMRLKIEADEGQYRLPAVGDAETIPPLSKAPKLLAVGDIFTDAFIKLSEEVAHVDEDDQGNSWLKIPFGGRPPYDEVEIINSVGPSPNSAVSCARLGLDVSLLSWIGDDEAGTESITHLKQEGVDTSLMHPQANAKSNYYYVLRLGADRTILTKDETYDYKWVEPKETPDWVYLASISEDTWQLHLDLLLYLNEHPNIRFVFQPGTFHFGWGKEKLADVYKRAELVIVNREEAMRITGLGHDDLPALFNAMHTLGPNKVVITDGPDGSYASYDWKMVSMPNYPDPALPIDRTGAGDAFASTLVAALALGKSMDEALTWAPINSMSVVQKLGAQAGLLTRERIEEYLKNAPEDYKLRQL